MSLQGSLETFALPDVLVLLSSTKKDGELRVVGGRADGRVWLEKGQIVHAAMGSTEVKPVDAIFELLRLESGTFNFDADEQAPKRAEPESIDLVLADAQVRLGEWNEIARVVPHLDVVVDMAAEAPGASVTVSRDQWSLLRRVAGGRSVHDLMESLGRSEFDTCKVVKELVDAKLASVDSSAKAKSAPAPEAPAPPVAKEPRKAEPKAKAQPEPEPVSAVEEDEDTATNVDDDLEALAALASRSPKGGAPKVRATTSATTDDGPGAANRPAATKAHQLPAPEEAKALVAQLAALSGDDEEAVAAKVTEHLASGGELPDVVDGDEPINRGLLLKFLSSVRN